MLCSKSRLTSKRYSTLCSTPSLTEVKHTRSSYSSRDDRLAFLPTCIICGFAGLCKGCRGIHGNFTGDPGGTIRPFCQRRQDGLQCGFPFACRATFLCRLTARQERSGADRRGVVGRLHKWSVGKRFDVDPAGRFLPVFILYQLFRRKLFVRRGKVGIVC